MINPAINNIVANESKQIFTSSLNIIELSEIVETVKVYIYLCTRVCLQSFQLFFSLLIIKHNKNNVNSDRLNFSYNYL